MSLARLLRESAARCFDPAAALSAVLGAAILIVLIGACGPSRNELPIRQAEKLAEEGRWEEAAEAFRSFPEHLASWRPFGSWRSASIYRDELRDMVRAEEALMDCSKRWSTTDWGYVCRVELGQLRMLRENYRGAIDAYRSAIELRPKGNYAETCLLESGRSYLAMGEPEQARLEWAELMSSFPGTPLGATVALEVARSHDLDGDQRKAVESYRSLVKTYPGHSVIPEARYGEGESLEQLGQLEEALELFKLLLHSHSNPGAVRVKVASIEARIVRRDGVNTSVLNGLKVEEPKTWNADQGVAPSGDDAVGEPMELLD